jgi:putative FmdB family regulatory protein
MPKYSFKCDKCEQVFEKTLKMSDPPPKLCSELNKENILCDGKLEKILTASSFALKGGGWFKDGY